MLGLGDIGPEAALPVMEGKAILFKEFGGIDAWPVCLATKDPDEIVRTVSCIAPVFGGINLEDISAPRCFDIERRLRDELDIPVFHDDQHGTAIVVLAALLNALRVVGKRLEDVSGRDHGRRRRRSGDRPDAAGRRRGRGALLRPSGRALPGSCRARPVQERAGRGDEPARRDAARPTTRSSGADVYIGLSSPGAVSRRGHPLDGG